MRKLIFTVGLFMLCIQLYAQWDFRTGYIITNSNDSISGFVRYNGAYDQKICVFRASPDATAEHYRPAQIKAYGFLGGYRYESAALEESAEKVFLTTLVAGKLSLFVYRDHFYIRIKDRLAPLSSTRTSADYFVTVLNPILSECGLAANTLSYSKTDLSNLTRNYNNCAGGETKEFRLRQPRSEVFYELFASYDHSGFSSNGSDFTFSAYAGVSAGAGLNIFFPRFNPRASVVAELWYTKKDVHAFGVYKKSIKTYYEDHFIDWKAIKIPVGIRYHLMDRNTTPYVELGVIKNLAIGKDIRLIQDISYNKEVITAQTEAKLGGQTSFGLWGSVGLTGHVVKGYRGFVEGRIEKSPFGTLPGAGARVSFLDISIVAGLRF
jgi:hypothetical protein